MANERLITASFNERSDYKQLLDQIHAIVHNYVDQNTGIYVGGQPLICRLGLSLSAAYNGELPHLDRLDAGDLVL
jgi:hypothetical protein